MSKPTNKFSPEVRERAGDGAVFALNIHNRTRVIQKVWDHTAHAFTAARWGKGQQVTVTKPENSTELARLTGYCKLWL